MGLIVAGLDIPTLAPLGLPRRTFRHRKQRQLLQDVFQGQYSGIDGIDIDVVLKGIRSEGLHAGPDDFHAGPHNIVLHPDGDALVAGGGRPLTPRRIAHPTRCDLLGQPKTGDRFSRQALSDRGWRYIDAMRSRTFAHAARGMPTDCSRGRWSGRRSPTTTSAAGSPPPEGSRSRHLETRLVHPAQQNLDPYASVAPPLYQTATFNQPGATTFGEYDYSRSGNPTRALLEKQMADIEGANAAFAFASGMAAICTAMRVVKPGEAILAGNDIYGGTQRFLGQIATAKQGLAVRHVDMTDLEQVKAACEDRDVPVRLVLVESPTNPKLEICDIAAICEIAHAEGALVCVDNSIMAPLFQRPLELGADISMTSATKFIAGHSDVTGGILAVKGETLAEEIYFHQNAEGNMMSPFEAWLSLRGLKTMSLRMEKQAENAKKIAEYLQGHPLVKKVNYAGSINHPGHEIHSKQAKCGGSIISFETGNVDVSRRIVEDTKLFKITVSFGSVSSLISMPCYMSHASVPPEIRAQRGLTDDLVRVSAGIEHIDDLIADLDAAMGSAKASLNGTIGSLSKGGAEST